jgi:hypothetical protein
MTAAVSNEVEDPVAGSSVIGATVVAAASGTVVVAPGTVVVVGGTAVGQIATET